MPAHQNTPIDSPESNAHTATDDARANENSKAVEAASGVTAPAGYVAAGVSADIKGNGNRRADLAIVYSQEPATIAGVFTTNRVKAAPVLHTRRVVDKGAPVRALIVNSGNANACTGDQGERDTLATAELVATELGIAPQEVAVSSTGVIGVPLPMERIREGISKASKELRQNGGAAAAKAIMTTDTFPKERTTKVELPGGGLITIGGMAKGSGMIHPNMATMLGFITTDARIEQAALQQALKDACDDSFNMITVDGDCSTNDMVLAMANGVAGNRIIDHGEPNDNYRVFSAALKELAMELAEELVRDGEGATKVMEVVVDGAANDHEARLAARAVASSSLVKTALHGEDANWGRILCALGYSGADFEPAEVDLRLGDLPVMEGGMGVQFDEGTASRVLEQKRVTFRVNLHNGTGRARAWGCDLSHAYVDINADYRT